jgi:hypothetical protein
MGDPNGAIPTFGKIVDLETKLTSANVPITTPGYLTTPGLRGKLKQTQIATNYPLMVWQGNELNGYPATYSNQMPSNLSKGASNGILHAMIFGNWSDLIIGEWGVLEIIVDPYRLKKQGVIEITSFVMIDIGVRYPVSFAAAVDCAIA